MISGNKTLQAGKFTFEVSIDHCGDPISAVEVWVNFQDEPCCDENGHQYRFYLPFAIQESSLQNVCNAFAKAVHSEKFLTAA